MKKNNKENYKWPREEKMITVTDGDSSWHPCYPNNQVKVSIFAFSYEHRNKTKFYGKVSAWGTDDFGVEIEFSANDKKSLMALYEHFKHYIYDEIEDGVNLEWFYKHGFINF